MGLFLNNLHDGSIILRKRHVNRQRYWRETPTYNTWQQKRYCHWRFQWSRHCKWRFDQQWIQPVSVAICTAGQAHFFMKIVYKGMQSKGLCSVAKVFMFFITWLFSIGSCFYTFVTRECILRNTYLFIILRVRIIASK